MKIVFLRDAYYNYAVTEAKSDKVLMSTLEYTVSMLESMPEDRLKEVQNYIRYIAFRDEGRVLTEMLQRVGKCRVALELCIH